MLSCVKRLLVSVIVAVLGLSSAACRMADGPLPPATGDVPNELGDISRDLWNTANGNPDGMADLATDLGHYAEGRDGGPVATAELSRRLGQALAGKMFMVAEALPLAHSCWLAAAGRQLSDKQVEDLQNEVKSQLMSLGVDEQQAQGVATQVGVVQRAVTARQRRWYELL